MVSNILFVQCSYCKCGCWLRICAELRVLARKSQPARRALTTSLHNLAPSFFAGPTSFSVDPATGRVYISEKVSLRMNLVAVRA